MLGGFGVNLMTFIGFCKPIFVKETDDVVVEGLQAALSNILSMVALNVLEHETYQKTQLNKVEVAKIIVKEIEIMAEEMKTHIIDKDAE